MNSLQGSFTPGNKKPQKKVIVDNPFEALKDVGTTTVDTFREASTDAVKSMWEQILGVGEHATKPSPKLSGDLKPKEVLNVSDLKKKKEQTSMSEAPMSYFKEIKEAGKVMSKESQEVRQQVQSIMYELQRLATASKTIEKQVSQAIGQGVISPGKYHVNFFEWMFSVIKDARKRVENAGAWMHTVKKKKGIFQTMKKNMSQYLSGERSVSNQTA